MPQLCKTGFVRPRCVPLRGRRPRRLTLGFVRRPGPRSFVQGATGRAQLRPESLNRRPADARVTGWSAPAGPGRALWWTNRRMQGTNQCRSRPSGSTLARPHGLSWPWTQRGKVVSWRRAHLHDGPRPHMEPHPHRPDTFAPTFRPAKITSHNRGGPYVRSAFARPHSERVCAADGHHRQLPAMPTSSRHSERDGTVVTVESAMETSLWRWLGAGLIRSQRIARGRRFSHNRVKACCASRDG
jgi:hypothetical protein